VGIVVGAWFVDSILTQATPGQSASALSSTLQSDLGVVFVAGLVAAALSAIAYVVLPYALADSATRLALIVAAILTLVIATIEISIVYPQIATAVAQATSGNTVNPGPVTALQGEATLLGAAQILPDMIFLWAYYKVRLRVLAGRIVPPPRDPPRTPFPTSR
jgi:hypothetical protein